MSKFGSKYYIGSNTEDTQGQVFLPVVRIGCPASLAGKRVLLHKVGDTLARGGGGGDPIPTMGRTLWYSRYTVIPLRVASLAPFVRPSRHDETATWVPLHHFQKSIICKNCADCIAADILGNHQETQRFLVKIFVLITVFLCQWTEKTDQDSSTVQSLNFLVS
jgi:hypothetical protein